MAATPGCAVPNCPSPGTLVCPKCQEQGRPDLWICSQDHLAAIWKSHKGVHKQPLPGASAADANTSADSSAEASSPSREASSSVAEPSSPSAPVTVSSPSSQVSSSNGSSSASAAVSAVTSPAASPSAGGPNRRKTTSSPGSAVAALASNLALAGVVYGGKSASASAAGGAEESASSSAAGDEEKETQSADMDVVRRPQRSKRSRRPPAKKKTFETFSSDLPAVANEVAKTTIVAGCAVAGCSQEGKLVCPVCADDPSLDDFWACSQEHFDQVYASHAAGVHPAPGTAPAKLVKQPDVLAAAERNTSRSKNDAKRAKIPVPATPGAAGAADALEVPEEEMSEAALALKRSMEEAKLLGNGGVLMKHGRQGAPHRRTVFQMEDKLYWCEAGRKNPKDGDCIDLRRARNVCKGKQTDVLRKAPKVPEELCFTVAGHLRDLNLQCVSAEERDLWYDAVLHRIQKLQPAFVEGHPYEALGDRAAEEAKEARAAEEAQAEILRSQQEKDAKTLAQMSEQERLHAEAVLRQQADARAVNQGKVLIRHSLKGASERMCFVSNGVLYVSRTKKLDTTGKDNVDLTSGVVQAFLLGRHSEALKKSKKIKEADACMTLVLSGGNASGPEEVNLEFPEGREERDRWARALSQWLPSGPLKRALFTELGIRATSGPEAENLALLQLQQQQQRSDAAAAGDESQAVPGAGGLQAGGSAGTASAESAADEEAKRRLEQRLRSTKLLGAGANLKKWPGNAGPQQRHAMVMSDGTCFFKKEGGLFGGGKQESVELAKLKAVFSGKSHEMWGRNKRTKSAPEELCFSVVLEDGSDTHLEMATVEERDAWLEAITVLFLRGNAAVAHVSPSPPAAPESAVAPDAAAAAVAPEDEQKDESVSPVSQEAVEAGG